VYDLTVPGTHTFLVGPGGIVAHNTTFLNALGACLVLVAASRTVTIEETRELALQKILPNCVALQARPPNLEGAGEVRIRDLVRNALRMRPDVIVVGEVRGGECWDMLQALNTGHAGCMSTVHANSPRDALERLVDLSMTADERPSAEVVTRMVARAIELVVQLRFDRDGVRRVASVFEVTGLEGSTIAGNELWAHDPEQDRLVWTGIRPRCLTRIAARGIPYALPSAAEARP
jgi:pilus assembly protein CpaF